MQGLGTNFEVVAVEVVVPEPLLQEIIPREPIRRQKPITS
jgi:hypothetical protein